MLCTVWAGYRPLEVNVNFFYLQFFKEELWIQGKLNVEREFDTLLNKFSDNSFSFELQQDNVDDSHISSIKGLKFSLDFLKGKRKQTFDFSSRE